MSGMRVGRNDPCPCGSGKKFKKCCSALDGFRVFSNPDQDFNPAAPQARFLLFAQPPSDNTAIDQLEVGRSRVTCTALPPYSEGASLAGTVAPPTPPEVYAKYDAIRRRNPGQVTEAVVEYTYPEMFGVAAVRLVCDADKHYRLHDGRVIGVLELAAGMRIVLEDGNLGTVSSVPEFRYEIPLPPIPSGEGKWSSRVVGRVCHTADELLEFRWAGKVCSGTPEHLFWSASRRGWVRLCELQPGEMVRVQENVIAPMERIGPRRPGRVTVYGIEVEYFHNYYVGGGPDAILVHNGPECIVKPASTPVGSKRSPLGSVDANPPTTINGRSYGGHAIDQMQARGVPPSVVENTIQHGAVSPDPIPGRLRHFDPVNNVTVITEGGKVVTVIPGQR